MHKLSFILLVLFFLPSASYGQVFNIKVIDYGGLDNSRILKNLLDNKIQDVENQVNDRLPNQSAQRFFEGMGNTAAIAGKNIGTDYTSGMKIWLAGVSLSGAVDLRRDPETNSDISGAGVATGATVGANMRRMGIDKFAGLDANRLNLYVNFLRFGHDQELYDRAGINSHGTLHNTTVGFRMRYDWIQGSGSNYLGWGGVKLHWGYQYTKEELTLENDLDLVLDVGDTNGQINGRITGRPKYHLEVENHSIPLEISTDVRLLQFLTFYGGAGVDINYGRTRGRGVVNGDVTPLLCTGGGLCGGGRLIRVQVQADLNGEAQVSPFLYRAFVGTQLNFPYVRIFAHVDRTVFDDILGATVGIRFVY